MYSKTMDVERKYLKLLRNEAIKHLKSYGNLDFMESVLKNGIISKGDAIDFIMNEYNKLRRDLEQANKNNGHGKEFDKYLDEINNALLILRTKLGL